MKARFTAGCVLGALHVTSSLCAQSQSIDEERSESKAATTPSTPSPSLSPKTSQPKAAPIVLPPRALSTPITYPAHAEGEQEVVLELTISKDGRVTHALAVSGAAPFSDAALEATKSWAFEPATRAAAPISAKIRFAVHFVPPSEVPTKSEPETASPSAGPVKLEPKRPPSGTQEILVVGQREPLRLTLGHADVHDLPGSFGDAYRAIEALPGVVPIVSGLPYFYVRGAPPGNVGYFFDGIPVPYLYHFAAGPSVLQPAFVDHVDLYPGAYPARYGRFAGAIVAGEMAPPAYRFHGEASIRLIDSGATIEAPFAEGRGSAMVGGRFSYTGAVLSLVQPDVSVNYWDYQARVRYELDSKNSLELLSFGAGDYLSDHESDYTSNPPGPNGEYSATPVRREKTLVDVNFHRVDLRWDHRIEGGNWRNALMVGRDRTGADNGNVDVFNHMAGVRSEYNQALSERTQLRAGGDVLFESLSQKVQNGNSDNSSVDSDPNNEDPDFGFDRARRDLTVGAWVDVVQSVTSKLDITPGLRADLFVSGGRVALAFDPRISARYALTQKLTVTHGLALVHQAPSFVVPVPGFKPSLKGGLQTALQYSAGASYALPAGFESSLNVFQNAFFNLTDLISLVQLQNTTSRDEKDFRATGHAYGVELLLRRSLSRRIGGFISYTLSRSTRSDGNLEGPATSDRTHVLNVALSGDLGRNWRLGGRWLFYSGIPTHVAYIRAAQAPPRTPPFWRLDFKLQKRWYIKRPDAWWGVALEVLNSTLNEETLDGNCNAYGCKYNAIGPVTIPSIGAEGAF